MGSKGSKPTPCDSGGTAYCSGQPNADGCVSTGETEFFCNCKSGYRSQGANQTAECTDIDECAEGKDTCRSEGADCTNTPGSYVCGCGDYGEKKDGKCVDVNECLVNRGGCLEYSDCINNDRAAPTCKCQPGWTGNDGKPGVPCRDINECAENPSICPASAICTNTPGSYKCECGAGYVADSSGSGCVTEDFCGTNKNDCDKNFAVCSLVPGSYKCECAPGFIGTGTVNSCSPLSGKEYLACQALNLECGDYKECTRSETALNGVASWECTDKSAGDQLVVFLANGPSSETPGWVWATVGLSSFLLVLLMGYLTWRLYKRFIKNTEDEENDPLYDEGEFGAGYSYGAVQGAFA